jgi:hypothetical protein
MCIRKTLLYAFCLFILTTGFAHAALVATDDSIGIPVSRVLTVEAFGVLDNDTLDGLNAGENGVTAALHTDVSKGTLSCPGVGPGICADGSFEYTPGPGFDGYDTFQYQAFSVSTSETSSPTTVTLSACSGGPSVYTCWHEAPYLAKLAELSYNAFQESFEGTAWDVARSPATAPGIMSKGVTWTTNHPATNEITTGSGPARTGLWGVFDPNHGVATGTTAECDVDNPPAHCLPYDGFSGSMPGPDVLYGVGGYITGFTGANVDIILDGAPHNAGRVPSPGHHFMGVIDTAGFNAFEYRELEGKVGQFLYIFGDDFTFATSAAPRINNAPILAPIGNQGTDENIQLSIPLSATDSDNGDTLNFSMTGGPAGASFYNNGDGTADFVWRPDYSQAGSYPVTFTVSDSAIPPATDSETITIIVDDVNRPPVLNAIGNKSVDENTELSIQLTASDPDGNSLSFVKSGGPPAATLIDHSDGTATFSWTPGLGQAGDYPVTFTVTDDGVPVASDLETITITVIGPLVDITPPQIQILSPTNGAVLTGSLVTVSGTASDDTVLASVTLNGIAATVGGGSFSTSVSLVAGANTLTAVATDSSGNTASTSIQVTYTPPDVTPPVITLLGITPVSIEAGTTYVDDGATALDNLDGDISTNIIPTSTVDITKAGSYSVTYNVSDAAGNAAMPMVRTVNVTAPVGSLQFSTASYSVAENAAMATTTVTRVNGSFGPIAVDYVSTDGSATDGSDYTAVSGSLSFADGETIQTLMVPIFDDVDYEGDETVNLSLSFPTGGASLGSPSTAVLTITEDDPVPLAGSLQFSTPIYTVDENGKTATITVTRINGSFGTVGVDYQSSDGTASAGSDYTSVSGSLSFADGVATQTITIDIIDDVDYEGDETINLSLSNPSGGAGLDSPSTAVLTIAEDDPVPPGGSLQLSAVTYSVAENEISATITISRVGGSSGTVGVDYASSDSTATAGSDYTAVIGRLSFADGVTSQSFTITILDDADYEGDETVNITLSNPTGGAGLGSPSTAILTITENDPGPPAGSLQFSTSSSTVVEDSITATITVTRAGGSFGTVSVDYASSDATATAGTDYSAVIGRLSFADGVTSQSFNIDILDDALYEGDEIVYLSLSNPSGGAGLVSPTTAVLNITEDDPVPPAGSLQFSATSYKVKENRTLATITVTRVGGSFGSVGVDYASSDDTATAGTDYTAVIGSLSFADGVTSQSFNIDVLDDTVYEGNESLNLTLSNPTGGAGLGSPFTVSLKISEDDAQLDEISTDGSSGGSIDVITIILLLSLYLRNFAGLARQRPRTNVHRD